LAAFALIGYFALYAWLRATGEIEIYGRYLQDGTLRYAVATRFDDPQERVRFTYRLLRFNSGGPNKYDPPMLPINRFGEWPKAMRVMWPAVKLEVALDRRGWLPGNGIPKSPLPKNISDY